MRGRDRERQRGKEGGREGRREGGRGGGLQWKLKVGKSLTNYAPRIFTDRNRNWLLWPWEGLCYPNMHE